MIAWAHESGESQEYRQRWERCQNQWSQELLKNLLSYLEAAKSITEMLSTNKGDGG